jgi:hypothetical protein
MERSSTQQPGRGPSSGELAELESMGLHAGPCVLHGQGLRGSTGCRARGGRSFGEASWKLFLVTWVEITDRPEVGARISLCSTSRPLSAELSHQCFFWKGDGSRQGGWL